MGLTEFWAINLTSDYHVFLHTCLIPTWRPGFISSKFVLMCNPKGKVDWMQIISNIIFIIIRAVMCTGASSEKPSEMANAIPFSQLRKSGFKEEKWFAPGSIWAAVLTMILCLYIKRSLLWLRWECGSADTFSWLWLTMFILVIWIPRERGCSEKALHGKPNNLSILQRKQTGWTNPHGRC